ncbi:hypothetical protein QR680_016441 [Steinernema hermaphroditum]|uniref:Uncharacterized protein n=1 Tax=Steinernema hermaphroditum TaxID=289476 RepID=A0AA39LM02_9BILA|nr:hypothetical protein QR680_016441 [Steinernema hermaphroditum]
MECEKKPPFLFPLLVSLVYIICIVMAIVVFLILNRKYLGNGGIRIRSESAREKAVPKSSKIASKGNRRDDVTDYDVTIAQTDAPTVA